jgi:hypothetical protein
MWPVGERVGREAYELQAQGAVGGVGQAHQVSLAQEPEAGRLQRVSDGGARRELLPEVLCDFAGDLLMHGDLGADHTGGVDAGERVDELHQGAGGDLSGVAAVDEHQRRRGGPVVRWPAAVEPGA